MLLTWKSFRRKLERGITGPSALKRFRKFNKTRDVLRPFNSPEDLVAWLLDYKSHPRDEEDRMLRVLRKLHLASESRDPLWMSIVILGLWPTLEWVFGRLQKTHKEGKAAFVILEEIAFTFEDERLWIKSKIAINLMYTVWKRSSQTLLKDQTEYKKLKKVVEHLALGVPRKGGKIIVEESKESWPLYAQKKQDPQSFSGVEIKPILSRLTKSFGLSETDAYIVIRHAVTGDSHSDIAADCHLSHVAVRQRYARAKKRIRAEFEKLQENDVTTIALEGLVFMEDKNGFNT